MAEVNIPDKAMDAADSVYGIGSDEEYERLRATLAAAAPLIVADYLERLVTDLEAVRQEMRAVDDRSQRSSGLGEGIIRIREHITGLRGEQR